MSYPLEKKESGDLFDISDVEEESQVDQKLIEKPYYSFRFQFNYIDEWVSFPNWLIAISMEIPLILWVSFIIFLDVLVAPDAIICSVLSINLSILGIFFKKISNLQSIWWLANFNGIVVSILGLIVKIYRFAMLDIFQMIEIQLIDVGSLTGLTDDDYIWEMIITVVMILILIISLCYHLIIVYIGNYHDESLPYFTIDKDDYGLVCVSFWCGYYGEDGDEDDANIV
ncbi:putative membrane protein [Wickerhamomyces ciferrii]|uniref:Membrane protein n=1 Tax=Wickerhamomyces ciferrii (strain ATCC 14091 / BCRC 22168 / CBS 111 / JCM 3599 / NBRC 0793 / NRRL Y-1031 F-60-10) TaxID=1206466 RepID=K0KA97_WICCF|nr:uncharacterized protein BN7_1404 [Wickerhamomyces ciferrii]CCH41865.1 putative membrane protein [Wickerhamomyces ciferrii]